MSQNDLVLSHSASVTCYSDPWFTGYRVLWSYGETIFCMTVKKRNWNQKQVGSEDKYTESKTSAPLSSIPADLTIKAPHASRRSFLLKTLATERSRNHSTNCFLFTLTTEREGSFKKTLMAEIGGLHTPQAAWNDGKALDKEARHLETVTKKKSQWVNENHGWSIHFPPSFSPLLLHDHAPICVYNFLKSTE